MIKLEKLNRNEAVRYLGGSGIALNYRMDRLMDECEKEIIAKSSPKYLYVEKDLPFLLENLVDGCKYAHRVDLAPKKELLKEVRTKGTAMNKDYKVFEKAFNFQLLSESKIYNIVEQFGKYENVALLCSEPTTEKCHRRLVSDMLLKKFGSEIKFGGNL